MNDDTGTSTGGGINIGAGTGIGTDDLRQAVRVAAELATLAIDEMTAAPSGAPRRKAHPADLVTDADERIEARVRKVLAERFPRHGVRGEEHGIRDGAAGAPVWLVDPIDGTTNHAHGIAWSSFALALVDGGAPLVAVVADPWRREIFSAVRGQGTLLDGIPVRACGATSLAGQVAMTEWAAHEPWPGMATVLAGLSHRYCTVRIMGSTALSLAQVAAGRAALAVIGPTGDLDALAATLIAVEAGAVALDHEGSPTLLATGGLLVAAPGVATEALEVTRAAWGAE